jgi:hypothetical protein
MWAAIQSGKIMRGKAGGGQIGLEGGKMEGSNFGI